MVQYVLYYGNTHMYTHRMYNSSYSLVLYWGIIISCRELSEERELLDNSVGEDHHLSCKLGRMERTLDRIDREKNSVRF